MPASGPTRSACRRRAACRAGIIAVIPGQVGIGVFSPRLDATATACAASRSAARSRRVFGLHVFSNHTNSGAVIRRELSGDGGPLEAPAGAGGAPAPRRAGRPHPPGRVAGRALLRLDRAAAPPARCARQGRRIHHPRLPPRPRGRPGGAPADDASSSTGSRRAAAGSSSPISPPTGALAPLHALLAAALRRHLRGRLRASRPGARMVRGSADRGDGARPRPAQNSRSPISTSSPACRATN